MAEISHVELPNGDLYDIKDYRLTGIVPVVGTQTSATGSWTGSINIPSLFDGLTIAYFLPYNGDGEATLNLTLSDNTKTGAIAVYSSGDVRTTMHYSAGSTIILTYWSAGSVSVAGQATTEARWVKADTTNKILHYGKSTWADFMAVYKTNSVIYCRASSNSNPATGSQTRMAFMAYVNNETSPTNVEFQYYRSVSSHSATQQGDQVYVYKLDKTAGWSVTVRESYTRIVAGTDISTAYKNGILTINFDGTIPSKTSDLTNDSGFVNTTEAANAAPVQSVNGQTGTVILGASDVGALQDTTVIPSKISDLTNDAGYLTSYTETDPTVPSWAKASNKPTYTASEVGAIPTPVSASSGDFLVYNGTAWTAQSLSTWQGGSY